VKGKKMNESTYDVNTADVNELLDQYQVSDEDLEHIRAAGKIVSQHMDEFVENWYAWLKTQSEFEQFFSDAEVLKHAQAMQVNYWKEFFEGRVDDDYIQHRQQLGQTHSRIGLPLKTYFAGSARFKTVISELLVSDGGLGKEISHCQQAIDKLVDLDISVVVETYTKLEQAKMEAQSRSIMEMSTPVTEIWRGVLLLPLVGIIDSKRALDIMNAMLSRISETHARIFILDISGVGIIDTAVANHLVKMTKATVLMGCQSTISGVSPAIAQTIVELGIDIGTVKTTATMRDALADAFGTLRLQITEMRKDHAR
jgi:rsbT co-antagonist protein RsbR